MTQEDSERRETCTAVIVPVQMVLGFDDRAWDCTTVISEALGHSLVDAGPGTLLDWQYHPEGPFLATPTEITIPSTGEYEKGDFRHGPYNPPGDTHQNGGEGAGRSVIITTLDLCMITDPAWSKEQAEDHLCDFVWTIPDLYDWCYLHLGGQPLRPRRVMVDEPMYYEEGDAFENSRG